MDELIDFLCGKSDYTIIRCQKFTRDQLKEMFEKKNTMEADLRNLIQNYWYAIECWKNKSTVTEKEMEDFESYCRDLIKKYNV